jgi:tetratricopeptide (TPR) repeat protein
MKRPLLITCFSLALFLSQSAVVAQAKTEIELKPSATEGADATKLDPSGNLPSANKGEAPPVSKTGQILDQLTQQVELPETLKALTTDQLAKYDEAKSEGVSYLRTVRLTEALAKFLEAENIPANRWSDANGANKPFPGIAELENLRGAVFTKMKDYQRARKHFANSLSLEKESFHPRFNIAELDFVEKQFELAIQGFESLVIENDRLKKVQLAKFSKEEDRSQIEKNFLSTERLIKYKLLICQLKLGKLEEADKIMASFDSFDDECPAYYFSKAVYEYIKPAEGQTAEKKRDEKAAGWIESAKSIYRPDQNEVYLDSIIEMGWLQALQ